MDHKPLFVIFKNDVATLPQWPQLNLLRIHQYRVRIIYKPGPDLFMADWLSRYNHNASKAKEITGMQISINAIQSTTNILDCMTVSELQEATSQDQHLQHQHLKTNTSSTSWNMSYKGGLTTKTNYHMTSEHTGHSEMTWQLLRG